MEWSGRTRCWRWKAWECNADRAGFGGRWHCTGKQVLRREERAFRMTTTLFGMERKDALLEMEGVGV